MEGGDTYASGREVGSRRRKLAGYLKAANDLRQNYQQAYGLSGREATYENGEETMPGSFTEGTVVRHGDEEMLLFPSYARRHQKKPPEERAERPGTGDGLRDEQGPGNEEYWRKEWEKYENDNAIVDVDIRGWIYAPQRGQMTRKNRILIGMARKLSGIPAPADSRGNSPSSPHQARATRHEEEMAEKEAQRIERRGQDEADVAGKGGYSELPSQGQNESDADTSMSSRDESPDTRSGRGKPPARTIHTPAQGIVKRTSWNQPSDMSQEELAVANGHLMLRLKPFLTTPLVSTPLTVFFYNDDTSKSRTISTNDAGHFTYRAALDFIPTHVRVLASESLSATEQVQITEPTGVSMISDIDDTIKHSAISAGAREIFRNAFIRELDDLSVDGVKEWYQTLADMGVQLHYVSNSPWQFYPVLTSFFDAAGLPRGSFHLKQYTGMLQGIFEPVAERKKGTLEKILADFPERRFILVGDSGEADLELYTDIMLANPGRIIGVFIRDVTTNPDHDFFNPTPRSRTSRLPHRPGASARTVTSPASALEEQRPILPPRPSARELSTLSRSEKREQAPSEKLIDIDDEPPASAVNYKTSTSTSSQSTTPTTKSPPPLPSKPFTLRPALTDRSGTSPSVDRKPAPPRPPKPRQYSSHNDPSTAPSDPSPLSQMQRNSANSVPQTPNRSSTTTSFESTRLSHFSTQNSSSSSKPPIPTTTKPSIPASSTSTSLNSTTSNRGNDEPPTYRAAVRSKMSAAYNALPSFYASNLASQPPPYYHAHSTTAKTPPPVPAPRRALTTGPSSQSQNTTHSNNSNPNTHNADNGSSTNRAPNSSAGNGTDGGDRGDRGDDGNGTENEDPYYLTKKEELWLRRWERAQGVFKEKGVMLRSWRSGVDVAGECVRVVEEALREGKKGREGR